MNTRSNVTRVHENAANRVVLEETAVSDLVREVLECASLTEALVAGMEALANVVRTNQTGGNQRFLDKEEIRRIHVAIRDAWIEEAKPMVEFQRNFLPLSPPVPVLRTHGQSRSQLSGELGYDTTYGIWD